MFRAGRCSPSAGMGVHLRRNTQVEFDRECREFKIVFNELFVGLMERGKIRYKHIDLKSYLSIGSVHVKNLYRYFDTKYELIRVKRSTLIRECGMSPDQAEKSLNYKIRSYLSRLEQENVLHVLSYNSKGKYRADPLITVVVVPKKKRTVALDQSNARFNGNYVEVR